MFRQFVQVGGPLMWPLLACSILLVAVLFERFLVVGVAYRLLGARPRSLFSHRKLLPFFTDVPPSLGLLGTVVGIVQSFNLMDGELNSDAMAIGLGVACMTTVFGLGIAIPASVAGYILDWMVASAVPQEAKK